MKLILNVAFVVLLAIAAFPQEKPAPPTNAPKEITVQLSPFSHIVLPNGWWAFMEKDFMDAWIGRIEPLDGNFPMSYSAGLIEPFEKNFGDPIEKGRVEGSGTWIDYSIFKVKKKKKVVASLYGSSFLADLRADGDLERFLEIVGRVRAGRCPDGCFAAANTKSMRGIFEKQTSPK